MTEDWSFGFNHPHHAGVQVREVGSLKRKINIPPFHRVAGRVENRSRLKPPQPVKTFAGFQQINPHALGHQDRQQPDAEKTKLAVIHKNPRHLALGDELRRVRRIE